MSTNFQVRPRFKIVVTKTPTEILEIIKKKINSDNSNVTGWVADRSASIHVIEETKRIWAPQLTIYAEEVENQTELRCVIGPGSSVWTTFVFLYAVIGLGALLGLFWGLSQLTLGHTPYAFWFIPAAAVLTTGVIYLAKVGQKLSSVQMKLLNEFIVDAAGGQTNIKYEIKDNFPGK
jgi:hypothetical protein